MYSSQRDVYTYKDPPHLQLEKKKKKNPAIKGPGGITYTQPMNTDRHRMNTKPTPLRPLDIQQPKKRHLIVNKRHTSGKTTQG